MSYFESPVFDFLSEGVGRKFTKDGLEKFLSTDAEAGSFHFTGLLFETLKDYRHSNLDYIAYVYITSSLVRVWSQNQHFDGDSYEFFQSSDFNSTSSIGRPVAQHMRNHMFMNENAIRFVESRESLGKFQNNTNGDADWLRTVVKLKGEKFVTSTNDFSPFLSAGVISSSDLIHVEDAPPELIAKLVRMDLRNLDVSLTYQAVRNLSRRFLRSGVMSSKQNRLGLNADSFLQDKELHGRFFDRFGVSFYDVLLERVKELIPVGSKMNTHSVILSDVAKYFFINGAGRFTKTSMEFYRTYKDTPEVQYAFNAFMGSLKQGTQAQLAEWVSVVTGEPVEQYQEIPKDWLVRMAETF